MARRHLDLAMRRMVEVFELNESELTHAPYRGSGYDCHAMIQKKYRHGPGRTKAVEFLTIEDLAVSPSANWALGQLTGGSDIFIRFKINCTHYFVGVDGSDHPGIPGLISPYPEAVVSKTFRLRPNIYVLPGQDFEVEIVHGSLEFAPENPCKKIFGCMNYIRYDGTDAVISNKLFEAGIHVSPVSIDSYKRTVMSGSSGGGTTAFLSPGIDGDMLAEFKEEILGELRKERKVKVSESINKAVQRAVRRELEDMWD